MKHQIIERLRRELVPQLNAGAFDPSEWLFSPEDQLLTRRDDLLVKIRVSSAFEVPGLFELSFAGEPIIYGSWQLPLDKVEKMPSEEEVKKRDDEELRAIEIAITNHRREVN
jgi:hypothetical protein